MAVVGDEIDPPPPGAEVDEPVGPPAGAGPALEVDRNPTGPGRSYWSAASSSGRDRRPSQLASTASTSKWTSSFERPSGRGPDGANPRSRLRRTRKGSPQRAPP